jgi:hypothetical protein
LIARCLRATSRRMKRARATHSVERTQTVSRKLFGKREGDALQRDGKARLSSCLISQGLLPNGAAGKSCDAACESPGGTCQRR